MQSKSSARAVILVLLAALSVRAGETRRFRPASHLQPGSLAHLSIADAARLRAALGGTIEGRILSHPAWRRVLAKTWDDLDGPLKRADALSRDWTGASLFDVVRLVQGEVVFDLYARSGSRSRGVPGNKVCEALSLRLW